MTSFEYQPDEKGLIHAFYLGQPKSRLGWDDLNQNQQKPLWVHLDRTNPFVEQWLQNNYDIDAQMVNSLLRGDTRPRFSEIDSEQALLIVKGINFYNQDTPEEMVSLRMWTDGKTLISLGFKPLQSVVKIVNQLESGNGPNSIESLLIALLKNLDSRIEPFVYELSNRLDELEEKNTKDHELDSQQISDLQLQASVLKRHLVPQRDVLRRMQQSNISWLKEQQNYWREFYYALEVYVDELTELVGRISMHLEAKNQILLQQSNQTMYLLSIIAAIFLPLSFLTGLLGINVGGMPGVEEPTAFLIVCVVVIALGILEYLFFKHKRWL
ncbi:CorA family divalent cation transporter [Aliikangiella maris]|uniref:CorA family divalent cation transporter n=2 Tax=Aliikangiella maris TaxID=3162458 RepID=A0ABV2BXE8_9GAMM